MGWTQFYHELNWDKFSCYITPCDPRLAIGCNYVCPYEYSYCYSLYAQGFLAWYCKKKNVWSSRLFLFEIGIHIKVCIVYGVSTVNLKSFYMALFNWVSTFIFHTYFWSAIHWSSTWWECKFQPKAVDLARV